MIRYKKYQMTGEKSPLKGLWYARPLIEELTLNLEHILFIRHQNGCLTKNCY